MIDVTVPITGTHIANGVPSGGDDQDPVISALRDALPGVTGAAIDHVSIDAGKVSLLVPARVLPGRRTVTVDLPADLCEFWYLFHWKQPVAPATFTVRAPKAALGDYLSPWKQARALASLRAALTRAGADRDRLAGEVQAANRRAAAASAAAAQWAREAVAAREAASAGAVRYDQMITAAAGELSALINAVAAGDGDSIQARIALKIIRDQIRAVREHGTEADQDRIRIIAVLCGEDTQAELAAARASARGTAGEARTGGAVRVDGLTMADVCFTGQGRPMGHHRMMAAEREGPVPATSAPAPAHPVNRIPAIIRVEGRGNLPVDRGDLTKLAAADWTEDDGYTPAATALAALRDGDPTAGRFYRYGPGVAWSASGVIPAGVYPLQPDSDSAQMPAAGQVRAGQVAAIHAAESNLRASRFDDAARSAAAGRHLLAVLRASTTDELNTWAEEDAAARAGDDMWPSVRPDMPDNEVREWAGPVTLTAGARAALAAAADLPVLDRSHIDGTGDLSDERPGHPHPWARAPYTLDYTLRDRVTGGLVNEEAPGTSDQDPGDDRQASR